MSYTIRRILLAGLLLVLLAPANLLRAQALSPGAKLLFRNTKTRLTAGEQNALFKQLGFVLSTDGKSFARDKNAMEFPFDVSVYNYDLNKDGTDEFFMIYGNTYTSGRTGASIILFVKSKSGAYTKYWDFPGIAVDVLLDKVAGGYPNLVIGGPGFSFPVWKWNGTQYVAAGKISEATLNKTKHITIPKQD